MTFRIFDASANEPLATIDAISANQAMREYMNQSYPSTNYTEVMSDVRDLEYWDLEVRDTLDRSVYFRLD